MSQVEWHIVKDVFYTALNRPAAERSGFLASACGDNEVLRSEVEFLLDSYESGFLEKPLLGKLAPKTKPDEPLFEVGRTFSHYKIIQLLGRGGMGEVYLADDLALDRLAAIKVIHADSGFGDQSAARLLREARSAAKLDHANICQVYEVGDADGHPFIAMQYVEGDLLDSLIGQNRVTFNDAVSFTRQIARGLAKAHSFGIVHRDIKPSNIIVDSLKRLKVLDFGLAKETLLNSEDVGLSSVGLIAGTVTYMSPEHARGQEIDGQTDIWSLGVVFYQMVAGKLPFRGETRADLVASILNDEIADPGDVPPAVRYILGRALEKDRSLRYASVDEFEADLAELAETGALAVHADALIPATAAAPATAFATAAVPFARYAITAALVLAIVGGGFGFWRYRSANAGGRSFSGAAASIQTSTIFDLKQFAGAAINDLSISPDGTMIAFSIGNTDKRESTVYVQLLTGGEPIRLTSDKFSYSPVWSADGQRIAYISYLDGQTAIFSVPIAGGDPAHLANLPADSASSELEKWSNDGQNIFIAFGGVPNRIDLVSGNITPIDVTGIVGKVGRYFAVSPDESRMLVDSTNEGRAQLWVKSLDSNDARPVDGVLSRNGAPAWFSDNRRFAYSAETTGSYQIYLGSIDGQQPLQVTFGNTEASTPAVSVSGDRIVYVSSLNEANLFSMDIASPNETVITSKTTMQVSPAFSPDGRRVAFSTFSSLQRMSQGSLKVASLDRSDGLQPAEFGSNGFGVRWLPNGEDLAYVRKQGSGFDIWKYRSSDKTELQITSGGITPVGHSILPFEVDGSNFDVSSNGSKFVFVSGRSGQANIWVADSDGGDDTAITEFQDGTTLPVNPCWSPTGDRIAFIEAIGEVVPLASKQNRVAVSSDGQIAIAARFDALTTLLDWSHDGNGVYVAVGTGRYFDIYFVPADGSGPQRKVRLSNPRKFSIRVSPDGRWVAYTQRRDETDNIFIVPLGGGQPQRVTANSDQTLYYSGVTWSPDSQTLLYSKQTGGIQIGMLTETNKERK